MTLLPIYDIKKELDIEFLPLEPMLTGLRLIEGGYSDFDLDSIQQELKVVFPIDYRNLLREFNFGKLTMGPIVFSNNGNYLIDLVRQNTELPWWGPGSRPESMLMVANSDPFVILMNTESGAIFAMDVEQGWEVSKMIASSFKLFVQGVGTALVVRNRRPDRAGLARDIAASVESNDLTYWLQLTR